jgi:DNA-binding CsgD family transcriptional regulator
VSLLGTGDRIRVFVSADSPVVRAGLESLIGGADRFELAATVESADVVIAEGTTPERGPVLLLTDDTPDKPDFSEGVQGILRRSASRDQILSALEALAAGLVVIDPEHAESLSWHSTPELDAAGAGLTPREIEVLRMLADGVSNKAIAFKLGISEHTAKFHVASILAKLNAASRTEAVTVGVRRGLIYL